MADISFVKILALVLLVASPVTSTPYNWTTTADPINFIPGSSLSLAIMGKATIVADP